MTSLLELLFLLLEMSDGLLGVCLEDFELLHVLDFHPLESLFMHIVLLGEHLMRLGKLGLVLLELDVQRLDKPLVLTLVCIKLDFDVVQLGVEVEFLLL